MTNVAMQTGTLLLAEPFSLDYFFKRAAVLLCEYRKDGAVGFILNKQTNSFVHEVMDGFPELDIPLFFGGPVAKNTLHYLHGLGDLIPGSHQVARGIWWGGDFETLLVLLEQEVITPDRIRFFAGYSGWSEGQLKEELDDRSWLVGEVDPNYVFNTKPTLLWASVLQDIGGVYTIFSSIEDEGDAKMN